MMRKDMIAGARSNMRDGFADELETTLSAFVPDYSSYAPPYLAEPDRDTRNDMIASMFAGYSLTDVLNEKAPTGWEYIHNDYTSGGGSYNGVAILQDLAGNKIVLKYDGDRGDERGNEGEGKGAAAEHDIALLYRDLDFAQPAMRRINPDATDSLHRDLFLVDYAGEEFGLSNAESAASRFGPSVYDYTQLRLADPDDIARFIASNAIMMNTDRHGYNIWIGTDENGENHFIPIDNGLAMGNADFGQLAPEMQQGDDRGVSLGDISKGLNGSNAHWLWSGGAWFDYYRNHDREHIKSVLVSWAERMRDAYAQKKSQMISHPGVLDVIEGRIQSLIDDPDGFIRELNT
jgi:hypothetical protein